MTVDGVEGGLLHAAAQGAAATHDVVGACDETDRLHCGGAALYELPLQRVSKVLEPSTPRAVVIQSIGAEVLTVQTRTHIGKSAHSFEETQRAEREAEREAKRVQRAAERVVRRAEREARLMAVEVQRTLSAVLTQVVADEQERQRAAKRALGEHLERAMER